MVCKDKKKRREYDRKRRYRRVCRKCGKKSVGFLCIKCYKKGRHGSPSHKRTVKKYNAKKKNNSENS